MRERTYQDEMEASVVDHYKQGIRQQLIVAATGTGKAVVIAKLINRLRGVITGGKDLVFAHREELVDQLVNTIKEWNPGLTVGKEMAEFYADQEVDVVVSCVASIGRNGSTRLNRFGDLRRVFCDEAHHSVAQSYINVFEATEVLKPETDKILVGFTATPKRKNRIADKKTQIFEDGDLVSLKSVYKKIVYSYPIRKAIKEGWLVPLRGYRVTTNTDISDVKSTAGDFQQDQLQEKLNTHERNLLMLHGWQQYGENRPTVGFTSGIEHAKSAAKLFQEHGIAAEAIWGNDPERAEKIKRHKDGKTLVLFNDSLLTEGYDDWRVSCILLGAPTRSSTRYTQKVGRGTRLQKGAGNLLDAIEQGFSLTKRDCIIIDVVDVSKRCSLVTLPSLFGLSADFDLKGANAVETIEAVEEAQENFPHISFAELKSLDNLKAYIEAIDIFADPFDEDVKEHSNLSWMISQDGSYLLPIPEKQYAAKHEYKHEKMRIVQNDLEEWELYLESKDKETLLTTENTLHDAFAVADDVLRRCRPDRINLMEREAGWHEKMATEKSRNYLKKLLKGRDSLKCLCPGIHSKGKVCEKCRRIQGISAGEVTRAIKRLTKGAR